MVDATRAPYDADALVDVAVSVFLERGYDGTSMSDIARAAGIGKSSIYHHVAGKEELLERGIRRALDALFAALEEPACSTGPAVDRLRAVISRQVEILVELPAEVALLLRVRGNTAVERWAMERRREFDRIITGIVTEAQESGSLRPELDPALVTRLVFGMANSVAEWYRPLASRTADQIVDAISTIVFDGIAQ